MAIVLLFSIKREIVPIGQKGYPSILKAFISRGNTPKKLLKEAK